MGLEAGTKALLDAGESCMKRQFVQNHNSNFLGITYDAVQTAFVGYCYGDSTSGQV